MRSQLGQLRLARRERRHRLRACRRSQGWPTHPMSATCHKPGSQITQSNCCKTGNPAVIVLLLTFHKYLVSTESANYILFELKLPNTSPVCLEVGKVLNETNPSLVWFGQIRYIIYIVTHIILYYGNDVTLNTQETHTCFG